MDNLVIQLLELESDDPRIHVNQGSYQKPQTVNPSPTRHALYDIVDGTVLVTRVSCFSRVPRNISCRRCFPRTLTDDNTSVRGHPGEEQGPSREGPRR